jgi:indolepyruvate ferredoxin oxidoreductase beta subunit
MKSLKCKILITGVGGQGIVFLTNIITEAAILSNVSVAVSEIHGLSQRGGMVFSGIGLGKNVSGFVGNADVDFMIGLEALETMRCLKYLNNKSSVIYSAYKIVPNSVNTGLEKYPDINEFNDYLKTNIMETVFFEKLPECLDTVLYNVFLLGRATNMMNFPFDKSILLKAINKTVLERHKEKTLKAFNLGCSYK